MPLPFPKAIQKAAYCFIDEINGNVRGIDCTVLFGVKKDTKDCSGDGFFSERFASKGSRAPRLLGSGG
jgi:hypothetical protein